MRDILLGCLVRWSHGAYMDHGKWVSILCNWKCLGQQWTISLFRTLVAATLPDMSPNITSTNRKPWYTIYSNWAQPTDRQAKTLDSHALLVAALMVAKSRSRQVRSIRRSGCFFYKRLVGVIGNQLIGPYFYRENLTGERSSNTTKICNKKYNVSFEKQKLDAESRDTRV
uniref:Uncharacterized protein n=1 Tax=Rhodnius prolixus TaxID=13249 RepID=T1HX02_RHOPR